MKLFLHGAILFLFINTVFAQNGQPDLSFGINGIAKTNMGMPYNKYNSAARQVLTNNKGSLFLLLNNSFIVKKLPNGGTDSSYGIDGFSKSIPISNGFAAMQPDGKIVIAGTPLSSAFFIIARLNADGMPDLSFGTNGIQTTTFEGPSYASAVALQADGKIVVAGNTTINNGTYFAIARYNINGSADNSFNTSGKVVTDFLFKTKSSGAHDSIDIHNAFANAIAVKTDGKIIAAGYALSGINTQLAMACYNPDGSLDKNFGNQGKQTISILNSNAIAYSIAIQPDKKIVLAGYVSNPNNTYSFITTRYKINGTADSSFNKIGVQILALASDMLIGNAVALQPDGKIVVAGYTLAGTNHNFAVARYNVDGSADNSFDGDGFLTTAIAGRDAYAGGIVIQNNKIVVSGYAINAEGLSAYVVTRYNDNGTPDASFNNNGKLEGTYQQGFTSFNATAVQTDGKLITAGLTFNGKDYDFAVVRYNINGSLDNTFNQTGIQITDFGTDDVANAIFIQTDGKIVVAGTSGNFNGQFAVARYNPNGSSDLSFNNTGKAKLMMGISDDLAGLIVQQDGKILLVGSTFKDANYDLSYFAIGRLNANGKPDKTFGTDGKQFINFESSSSFAAAVAGQKDGKVLIAGRVFSAGKDKFAVARLNIDGSLDNSFSADGKQTNSFGDNDYFGQALAIEPNGKILLAGYDQSNNGLVNLWSLVCYLPNGNLDVSFGKNGYQTTDMGPQLSPTKSIAINADGKIAIGGGNGNFALLLYKNNGNPDSSFGTNGIQINSIGIDASAIHSLCFSNNKLYACGNANYPGSFGVVTRYLLATDNSTAVSFKNFSATIQNKNVLLQWQSFLQNGIPGFTIQRSTDGTHFTSIGFVEAKQNSLMNATYSTVDNQPLTGNSYYRLRVTDLNGNCIFSEVAAIFINAESAGITIYPNPVVDVLFIKSVGENQKAVLTIIDGSGKKLKFVNVALINNVVQQIPVNNLSRGLYNLQIETKIGTETKNFIKQ